MAAQALYRKWRSRTFEEVVGQEHVTRTLQNALRGGHVAHAYLFAGPRGTGKTSTARLLAKAVNCTGPEGERPCNRCSLCQAIDEGRLMDLIEIDAASNRGIDEIRDLRQKVGFRPSEAHYKVYVIDEVHMLTNEAFNALLKTLEEPPPHVIFVLATTEPHKIPATVLSRCQRFDFRRIPLAAMIARLEHIAAHENLSVEAKALEFIARQATGSLRDAISLLDQLTAYSGQSITLAQVQTVLGAISSQAVGKLVDLLIERNAADGLTFIQQLIGDGADPRQFNRELVEYLRGLLLIKTVGDTSLLNVPGEMGEAMAAQAARLSTRELIRQVKLFNQAGLDLRRGLQASLPLELAFVEATLDERDEEAEARAAPPSATASPPSAVAKTASPSRPMRERRVSEASAEGLTASEGLSTKPPVPSSPARPAPPPVAGQEPAGAPVAEEGRFTLEDLRLNWDRILAEIRPHDPKIEALLKDSQAVAIEGQKVVIGFYYVFHKERIADDKNRSLVEKVISRVMGCPCQVKCVYTPRDKSNQKSAAKPKAPAPETSPDKDRYQAATEDPVIRAAVKRYGAQVADVQPPSD